MTAQFDSGFGLASNGRPAPPRRDDPGVGPRLIVPSKYNGPSRAQLVRLVILDVTGGHNDPPDATIAAELGVNRRSLSRWRQRADYRAARAAAVDAQAFYRELYFTARYPGAAVGDADRAAEQVLTALREMWRDG